MLTTILAGIGIGLTHLIIGAYIGKWSISVWEKGKENFWSFVLFPINTLEKRIGSSATVACIVEFNTNEGYIKTMAFMWSSKLAYHLVFVFPILGAIYTIRQIGSFTAGIAIRIAGFFERPLAALKNWSEKRQLQKMEKAKQLTPSKTNPMLDGYTRADIEIQMEEQRRIIEAKTAEVEANTAEYERLKKIHETTWSRG